VAGNAGHGDAPGHAATPAPSAAAGRPARPHPAGGGGAQTIGRAGRPIYPRHSAPPARSLPAAVVHEIAHSSPQVLVLAGGALVLLLLLPGVLLPLVRPRPRGEDPRP
jgi:hypothetical protein